MSEHPLPIDEPAPPSADPEVADPARGLAVVTCMDVRVDPASAFGLDPGDAHVLRNAGGRVSQDVLRSLIASTWLMGVRDVAVVHHTRCGLGGGEEAVRAALEDAGAGGEVVDRDHDAFLDPEGSVRDDMERLRTSGVLPQDVAVHGYLYDVSAGTLRRVTD